MLTAMITITILICWVNKTKPKTTMDPILLLREVFGLGTELYKHNICLSEAWEGHTQRYESGQEYERDR